MKPCAWMLGLGLLLWGSAVGVQGAEEATDGGQPLALAVKPRIQKELGLSVEQTAHLRKLYEDGGQSVAAAHAALGKELTPEQMRRLKEISFQVRGGSALASEAVRKELDLNTTQTRKIVDIWKNEEENLRQVLRITRFRTPAVKRKFVLEHRRSAGKRMLEVLDEGQVAAWKKLQGKEFDLTGLES